MNRALVRVVLEVGAHLPLRHRHRALPHSLAEGRRVGPGAAGRGREGSESWLELPLTQCREAREGRRAALLCPLRSQTPRPAGGAQGCHSLPTVQHTCPRRAIQVTAHSPAHSKVHGEGGSSPGLGGLWSPGVGH